jgi:hypothetical protein
MTTTQPTRRGEMNARLRELCAVRTALADDLDDAVVLSEYVSVVEQIAKLKAMLWPQS